MGLDDQHQQATIGCSLLRVRSDTTHHVSNETGRTRVQMQPNETTEVTHMKGFNSALVQRDGPYFMTTEFVNIPVNMQLEVHQTTQGTTAKITPGTLTQVWRP